MLLHIGLTGGIGAGKSTVAAMFARLGAHVIDADQLAKKVLEPGSSALAEIDRIFGPNFIQPDGQLDRKALGALVFNNPAELNKLNAIVHPAVGKLTLAEIAKVPPGSILLHDVPLIAENNLQANYHLVFVAHCAPETRIARLTSERGMEREDALARITAQATDEQRRAIAHGLIPTQGSLENTRGVVEKLWNKRVLPMQRNIERNTRAPHSRHVHLVPAPPPPRTWHRQAALLNARLEYALECAGIRSHEDYLVDHVGSTAIPGMWAKDVLDVQIRVRVETMLPQVSAALISAGFPGGPGFDHVKPGWGADAAGISAKYFHANADPEREVHIHVRLADSPAAQYVLGFAALHQRNISQRNSYAQFKAELVRSGAERSEYARGKEGYFDDVWPGIVQLLAQEPLT